MDRLDRESLSPVESPEVRLDELQREIVRRAQPIGGPPWPTMAAPATTAGPHRSPVHGSAAIRPYPNAHEVDGRLLRRLVRRALRWYLWPVTQSMTEHNQATSSVLAEHRRQLDRLKLERERTDRNLEITARRRRTWTARK
jgi:hypothetical protein